MVTMEEGTVQNVDVDVMAKAAMVVAAITQNHMMSTYKVAFLSHWISLLVPSEINPFKSQAGE